MTNRISAALKNNGDLVENALKNYLNSCGTKYDILYEAMRYSTLGGGKRIRPFLVLEFCRLHGGKDRAALPFACAIELVHAYSLIHDDLPCMDNDDLRRGNPTCHKKFGEATALLTGDALLTYAFEVAASNGEVDCKTALEAVRLIAGNAGVSGMVGGQQLDLDGEKGGMDYDTFLQMNRLKTGCLIKTACMLGCMAAGQQDMTAAAIYAENIGLAFQIIDDIMDSGEEDQKTTFMTFMSCEKAYELASGLTQKACTAIEHLKNHETLTEFAKYLLDRRI